MKIKGIPEFVELLEDMKKTHEKKNNDYAAEGKHFENFERVAAIIGWFNNNEDKAFVAHIVTKLARLSTLLNKKSVPNNEPIEDSFEDLTVYCGLWGSYHKRKNASSR